MASLRNATIRIPYSHLAPGVKDLVGHAFQGNFLSLFNRFFGVDRATEFVVRYLAQQRGHDGLVEYHNTRGFANTYSIRSARLSRLLAEAHMLRDTGRALKMPDPLVITALSLNGISRIEAARLVQVLHEELVKQMRHSGIVSPHFSKQYSPEMLNVNMLARTHPIFTVGTGGSIIFSRPTRMEYARFKFQSTREGKLGIQPWAWRGYLEQPNPPESWKKWTTAKVREWAAKFRPAPVPSPAYVPVRTTHPAKKTLTPRRRLRR